MDTNATDRFVHDENLKRLHKLLLRTNEEEQCQRIMKLIEEEESVRHQN